MSQAIRHVVRKTPRSGYQQELGRRVAELLAAAWRDSPLNAPTLSEAELNEIVPLLCDSGAGALAWWRLRDTPLANTEGGQQLHDVYRRHRLSALIHEREIAYVLSLLRVEGIEPVLIKGWAIARLYPDAGLRPYGDIDLCIRPDQFEQAAAALKCLEELDGHYVDLHEGFSRIGQTRPGDGIRRLHRLRRFKFNAAEMRVWDELFSRSKLVALNQTAAVARPSGRVWVRVPSDEDHLRILSSHLLRSGARRPPWLCDVALLIESIAKDFNWDVCVSDRLHGNWVASAVMLVRELFGADIRHTPFADQHAPRWLVPAILRQWGRTRVPGSAGEHRLWTFGFGLWTRFDNPVRATAAVGGQFNNWPRLPYRLGESIMRLPELPQLLLANRRTGEQKKRGRGQGEGSSPGPDRRPLISLTSGPQF